MCDKRFFCKRWDGVVFGLPACFLGRSPLVLLPAWVVLLYDSSSSPVWLNRRAPVVVSSVAQGFFYCRACTCSLLGIVSCLSFCNVDPGNAAPRHRVDSHHCLFNNATRLTHAGSVAGHLIRICNYATRVVRWNFSNKTLIVPWCIVYYSLNSLMTCVCCRSGLCYSMVRALLGAHLLTMYV